MFNDLLDVKIIWEVAKHRSFAAAGRALKQPPATVSRRVSAMEKNAGVRFFERTTRNVQITEQGKMVVGHARRILDETEAVQVSIEALRAAPTGKVRISAPVILGEVFLGAVVQEFLQQYPGCQAFIDVSNKRVDLIEEQYDVAIRVGHPGDKDLIARRLGFVEAGLYLAANAQSQASMLKVKRPSQIANLPVMLMQGSDQNMSSLDLYGEGDTCETVPIQSQLVTNNPVLLLQAGASGEALMVLPRMLASEGVRQGNLIPILPKWAVSRVEVFALMTSRKLMRPAVRAFIDIMVSVLQEKLT